MNIDSFESAGVFQDRLSRDEELLWAGQPRQGVFLRPHDALLIPFSLMWGGFAIFWEGAALVGGAPWFFALWGIPFVLVGLYLIAGRFWFDAYQRSRTVYGVTTERIVILSGSFSRQLKSLNLDTLADVTLTERADGRGTISFGPTMPWYMGHMGGGWPGMGAAMSPSFESIPDARSVYDLIHDARRAAKAKP